MDHTWPHSLSDLGNTQHSSSVIVHLDDITVLDTSGTGIRLVNTNNMPGIAIFEYAMSWNIFQPGDMNIVMSVEGKSGMW